METGGSLVCSQKPATGPYLHLQDETVLYELTKHLLQTHSGQRALLQNYVSINCPVQSHVPHGLKLMN